ncbi:MAG TPA: nicotianamine synthase family protein [Pseudonocardiaceae bacterium]
MTTDPIGSPSASTYAGSAGWRHSEIVVDLLRLHQELSTLPTLEPNAHTNALFDQLVRLVIDSDDDQAAQRVLAEPEIHRIVPELRGLCSSAEVELERAWARRIVASHDPERELREFPYFTNYEQLTRMEHHGVLGVTERGSRCRMLFVGAGPLPLTSLLLASRHGRTDIDNIDVDPEAVRLATQVAGALRIHSLRFWCADVLTCTNLANYDVVCLAALVGAEPDLKSRVIKHLYQHMRPGALLLARSARSLRALLYPPLAIGDLAGFRPLAVLNPYTEVINSLVVAEKPTAPHPMDDASEA